MCIHVYLLQKNEQILFIEVNDEKAVKKQFRQEQIIFKGVWQYIYMQFADPQQTPDTNRVTALNRQKS